MSTTAPATSQLSSTHLRGAALSILISAVFAVIWGINGSLALTGDWRFVAVAVLVVITAAMGWLIVTFRREAARAPASAGAPLPNPFVTTAYRVSLVAMLVAFPVTARILTADGLENAIMPAVVVIVGLHFLGLVSAFRNGIFAWVAGAFCVLGVASLFLPVELRTAVLGLGCAVVLWLGVTPLALRLLGQIRQIHAAA